MGTIDWIVMSLTMFTVIGYGIWKTRQNKNIEGFLLGGNEAKWWTVGLSVMATQASAITFLSTPGQAYNDGMGFLQFYFTLPIAMIIICVTFIPIFYRLKVYTAYEYLESRFDVKTRSMTSFLFLIQRGLAAGITIYAPAIILSSVMGWNLNSTVIFIGIVAILYTVSGGTRAVHVTHKIQMTIILIGLVIIFILLLNMLPEQYSFNQMMSLAGASGKLDVINTEFDWKDRYNIWTCLLAAPFLFLSYFGTDQSQVQRYISGKSVGDSRRGLLMNGLAKVPLQFFILFIGVLVFLFFQFTKAPIFFNENQIVAVQQSAQAEEGNQLIDQYNGLITERENFYQAYLNNPDDITNVAALQDIQAKEAIIRADFKELISTVDPEAETNDKDYVFINFILNHLPIGLVGLLFAMIFFAAMSSTASELNALASTTTVDIYKRLFNRKGSERQDLIASRLFTLMWGLIAIAFARFGTLSENLIQFVNIVGSVFYGTILGIFLVAFYIKRVSSNAVFIAAIITQMIVFYLFWLDQIGYLWFNLIGTIGVIVLSLVIEETRR